MFIYSWRYFVLIRFATVSHDKGLASLVLEAKTLFDDEQLECLAWLLKSLVNVLVERAPGVSIGSLTEEDANRYAICHDRALVLGSPNTPSLRLVQSLQSVLMKTDASPRSFITLQDLLHVVLYISDDRSLKSIIPGESSIGLPCISTRILTLLSQRLSEDSIRFGHIRLRDRHG